MAETTPELTQKLISSISEYETRISGRCCGANRLTRHSSQKRGDFTDLTLAQDLGNFRVHRLIVCVLSKFFQKACTGGFEVGHILYD